jgi:hypothetical protein
VRPHVCPLARHSGKRRPHARHTHHPTIRRALLSPAPAETARARAPNTSRKTHTHTPSIRRASSCPARPRKWPECEHQTPRYVRALRTWAGGRLPTTTWRGRRPLSTCCGWGQPSALRQGLEGAPPGRKGRGPEGGAQGVGGPVWAGEKGLGSTVRRRGAVCKGGRKKEGKRGVSRCRDKARDGLRRTIHR